MIELQFFVLTGRKENFIFVGYFFIWGQALSLQANWAESTHPFFFQVKMQQSFFNDLGFCN